MLMSLLNTFLFAKRNNLNKIKILKLKHKIYNEINKLLIKNNSQRQNNFIFKNFINIQI